MTNSCRLWVWVRLGLRRILVASEWSKHRIAFVVRLLPIVAGWLHISPECDSKRLQNAIDRANQIAYVASGDQPELVSSKSRRYAISLRSDRRDVLRRDEGARCPFTTMLASCHGSGDHRRHIPCSFRMGRPPYSRRPRGGMGESVKSLSTIPSSKQNGYTSAGSQILPA